MSEPNLVFLPWARRGGALDLPEDLRDGHPASHASATAEVRVNGAGPASVSVQLLGPGDVTALAPQQVIRTDPAPGTRTFESNYLASWSWTSRPCPGCSPRPRRRRAGCDRGCASSWSASSRACGWRRRRAARCRS